MRGKLIRSWKRFSLHTTFALFQVSCMFHEQIIELGAQHIQVCEMKSHSSRSRFKGSVFAEWQKSNAGQASTKHYTEIYLYLNVHGSGWVWCCSRRHTRATLCNPTAPVGSFSCWNNHHPPHPPSDHFSPHEGTRFSQTGSPVLLGWDATLKTVCQIWQEKKNVATKHFWSQGLFLNLLHAGNTHHYPSICS